MLFLSFLSLSNQKVQKNFYKTHFTEEINLFLLKLLTYVICMECNRHGKKLSCLYLTHIIIPLFVNLVVWNTFSFLVTTKHSQAYQLIIALAKMSSRSKVHWSIIIGLHFFLVLQIGSRITFAQSTPVDSFSSSPSNLPFTPIPIQGILLPKVPMQPYCAKAHAHPNCLVVPTFDFIDLKFFVGTWYEIGTTGQNKLRNEAGGICQQVNYTLSSQVGNTTKLEVVNTALHTSGRVATFGIETIGGATRRVCNAAKKICSSLSPTSQIIQTSAQVSESFDI